MKKKIDFRKIGQEATNPMLILGGMYVGRIVGTQLDKLFGNTQAATSEASGLEGLDLKGLATPLVLGIGGLALSTMVDDKRVKYLGYGVASAGAVKLIQQVTGKNLLQGLAGVNGDQVTIAALPAGYNVDAASREIDRVIAQATAGAQGTGAAEDDLIAGIAGQISGDDDTQEMIA